MTAQVRARLLAGTAALIVAAAVAAGLLALGPPAEARKRRLDDRRIQDLAAIEVAIRAHHSDTGSLPLTLSDLDPDSTGRQLFIDPSGKNSYEYYVIDSRRYEVCAVFQGPDRRALGDWNHRAGRQCFRKAVQSGRLVQ